MKKITNMPPMLDNEKQITPMPNEIDLNNSFFRVTAAVRKAKRIVSQGKAAESKKTGAKLDG